MIVYKFGGASVKSADGVKKLAQIVQLANQDLLVVVSAMAKITNTLENIVKLYLDGNKFYLEKYDEIKRFHLAICNELFNNEMPASLKNKIEGLFNELLDALNSKPSDNYDFEYDKLVSFGELFSTSIISGYLNAIGVNNEWVDIRTIIKTDNNYRDARVDENISKQLVQNKIVFNKKHIYLTQGFIASDRNGNSTTLGREGSDYTASLLCNYLDGEKVVVWKDVSGIMNADPVWYNDAIKIPEMNYKEAIELAFYGAKVIHPKTIKPLQNKNIPMQVKSFINPDEKGTSISSKEVYISDSIYILKENQVLISISQPDFSFIFEKGLSNIYKIFADNNVKINMMQNSALSLSVCCDNDIIRIPYLFKALKLEYIYRYNSNVELLTIRHYKNSSYSKFLKNRKILMEQRSRNTAQYVYSK